MLDSLLFFGSSLKKLLKMLGLELECEKGFHPYYFYDLNYVGEIVDKKYFDFSNVNEWNLTNGMILIKIESIVLQKKLSNIVVAM